MFFFLQRNLTLVNKIWPTCVEVRLWDLCSCQEDNKLVFDSLARKPSALVTSQPCEHFPHEREKFLQYNVFIKKTK